MRHVVNLATIGACIHVGTITNGFSTISIHWYRTWRSDILWYFGIIIRLRLLFSFVGLYIFIAQFKKGNLISEWASDALNGRMRGLQVESFRYKLINWMIVALRFFFGVRFFCSGPDTKLVTFQPLPGKRWAIVQPQASLVD